MVTITTGLVVAVVVCRMTTTLLVMGDSVVQEVDPLMVVVRLLVMVVLAVEIMVLMVVLELTHLLNGLVMLVPKLEVVTVESDKVTGLI